MNIKDLRVEDCRWDLSFFYRDISDPQLDSDLADLLRRYKDFESNFRGQLKSRLGDSLQALTEIAMIESKILGYLFLSQSLDVSNASVKARANDIRNEVTSISAECMSFFDIELCEIPDGELEEIYKKDNVALRHKSWIDHRRIFRDHLLSEPVEAALEKRSPFGPGAWDEFYDELRSALRANVNGQEKSVEEIGHIVSTSHDPDERFKAMKAMNDACNLYMTKYSAQALYMITGSRNLEGRERKYKHPMEGRNKLNKVSDATIDSLHQAVLDIGGPLAQRYYRLKAKILGLDKLRWSDRFSPFPFSDSSTTPIGEALETVLAAYKSFSPTLSGIIENLVAEKKLDAPPGENKRGGGFNYSLVMPGGQTHSFTLVNYFGSSHDVSTLAHEFGHAVHGILAGNAQGPLMDSPGIVYLETASIFGEMTAFNFVRRQLEEKGDKKSLLAFVLDRIQDILGSTVNQIFFSNFERRMHGLDEKYSKWTKPTKLSPAEMSQIWSTVREEMYGRQGEIFDYTGSENGWCLVPHFYTPFYVYGYAFGEFMTHSLYAKQAELGDKFEPLYLDILRAGSTRDAKDLLAPFGLNPEDEKFWETGIKVGLEPLIIEAESLAAELGLIKN